jgi:hypothetical protein
MLRHIQEIIRLEGGDEYQEGRNDEEAARQNRRPRR